MILVAAALGLALQSSWWAEAPVAQERPHDGWTYQGRGVNGTELFTRRANQPRRLWVRYEYHEPNATGHLSDRMLVEFDCDGRYQTLQHHAFAKNDLLGDGQGMPVEGWTYVPPGTMSEKQESIVCYPADNAP